MKKLVSIALALVFALSLCACGQSSSSAGKIPSTPPNESPTSTPVRSATPSPTPDTLIQEQMNGFDEATNKEIPFKGFTLSVPAYWGEPEQNDSSYRFNVKNCGIVLFAGGENPSSIPENLSQEGKITIVKESLDSINAAVTDIAVEDGSFLDMRTINFTAKSISGAFDSDVFGSISFDNSRLFFALMFNLSSSDYSIKDDFYRVLSSVKQAEEKEATGINPDFKDALDSYEAFIDQYVDFMNKYMQNPTDFGLLASYMDFLSQYQEMSQKIESMNQADMTNEELAYYIDVTARISKKLLGVLG